MPPLLEELVVAGNLGAQDWKLAQTLGGEHLMSMDIPRVETARERAKRRNPPALLSRPKRLVAGNRRLAAIARPARGSLRL